MPKLSQQDPTDRTSMDPGQTTQQGKQEIESTETKTEQKAQPKEVVIQFNSLLARRMQVYLSATHKLAGVAQHDRQFAVDLIEAIEGYFKQVQQSTQ